MQAVSRTSKKPLVLDRILPRFIIFCPFSIGQIEGGFVFGLGFWLQEQIKHDPTTGQLLTNDTWVSGIKILKSAI